MRKGLSWIVQKGLGWMVRGEEVNEVKEKEVEKMRKGLSVIVGIAILLFAYSASAGVVTSNLVSWWKFDETSGTNAADEQLANPGTLVGVPTWTNDTAGSASYRALDFDGSSDYVDCGTNASLNITGGLTLEAWVKPASVSGIRDIISKANGDSVVDAVYDFRIADGNLQFLHGDGTNYEGGTLMSGVVTGFWQHLVVTRDGTQLIGYINGVAGTPVTQNYTPGQQNVATTIGRRSTGHDLFYGIIDEVRIYNRALDADEVLQNYNAIPEPSTLLLLGAGLMSLLTFRRIGKRS